MTIETRAIEEAIKATPDDLARFSKQTGGKGFLNIVRAANGWAIVGPDGMFQDETGNSFFSTPSELHSRLSDWNFKHFFQEGDFCVLLKQA